MKKELDIKFYSAIHHSENPVNSGSKKESHIRVSVTSSINFSVRAVTCGLIDMAKASATGRNCSWK
ncbi:hypothetical protein MTO98_07250 [Mucilaginibacter sp. SMC90]|uniref:hypothetical protein n=1 Tax=Mucilaginibacter sp. SMC90 TaxID=2929803 RepID=UPI001FB361E9|nr:hypothetical protein [Mucilaginibacter sp. SMC90]UOE50872.1 hypothetical protein MTO98_07250 [Mucilaginibacter sp. SMC90]